MKKFIGLYLILGIFSIFIWPRIFPRNPQATFDEHTYSWLATQIRDNGIGFLKSFTPTFLSDEKLKTQAPPNRALLPIFLALTNSKGSEPTDFQSSMMVIQIAWLILVGWICWKEFGPRRGIIPFAFFCCSPFWLGTSGRIWVDWFFNLFILAAFWNGIQWWRNGSKENLAFLNVSILLAALTKETIILYLMGFFCVLLYLSYSPEARSGQSTQSKRLNGLWISLFIGSGAITLWLFLLSGNSFDLLIRMSQVGDTNVWANAFSKGPWFRYFADELMINPVAFLLALAMLLKRKVDEPFKIWRNWFWIVFLGFALLPFKELRYLGHLELPIAIALFFQLQTWAKKKASIIILSVLVMICSLTQARLLFAKEGLTKDGMLLGTSYELFLFQKFWSPSGK